ncbi:hypothetical protein [Leuconostoc citreum]
MSKSHSNDTELSDTKVSDTETNKPDDEEINVTSNLTVYTEREADPLIQMGKLLANDIELRSTVHKLIPDLLLNDAPQALEVVNTLASAKQYLFRELENGNTVLKQRQIVRGQEFITSLLEDIAAKQLVYMNEHLVNAKYFGEYFKKGLKQRLRVAITTDKFAVGL